MMRTAKEQKKAEITGWSLIIITVILAIFILHNMILLGIKDSDNEHTERVLKAKALVAQVPKCKGLFNAMMENGELSPSEYDELLYFSNEKGGPISVRCHSCGWLIDVKGKK